MILSKDIPEKIDVLEFILPKLRMMTVESSSKDDIRIPELRFIEFIEELAINTAAAEKLIRLVDTWNVRVANEQKLMEKRADGYLELYATDYNKYFKETKNYKTQESRMLSLLGAIYEEFTNTSIIEKHKCYDEEWKRKLHSLFDSSPLNRLYVQNSFYGVDELQPPHQLLFAKLQNLFLKLQKLFEFAQGVDNMVEGVRKNHERVMEIFYKCKKKKKDGDLKYIIPALDYSVLETMFPVLVKDLQDLSFKDFIVKYYHELNEAEFAYIIPLYEKVLKESYGIEKDEASLYDDVIELQEKIKRVKKLRVLIEHLDEFDIKGIKVPGKQKYYISSYFVAMLIEKAQIPYGKWEEFVEKYFKKHYHGDYVPVGYKAVNKAQKNLVKNPKAYSAFDVKAQKIIDDSEKQDSQNDKKKVSLNTNIDTQSSILTRIFA